VIRIFYFFTILIISSFSLFNCSSKVVNKNKEPIDKILSKTKKLFYKEKFYKVITYLEPRINRYNGEKKLDSLMYFLGIAYLEEKEYEKAENEFRKITQIFRESPLRPYAQYYLAQVYMRRLPDPQRDQTITKMALRELMFFTELYPDHPLISLVKEDIRICRNNLAQKAYLNGYFYYKTKEYSAAKIYFLDVINEYFDTKWVDNATAKLVLCYIYLDDIDNARKYYELLKTLKLDKQSKQDYKKIRLLIKQKGIKL